MSRLDIDRIRTYLQDHDLSLFLTMDPQLGHHLTGWMPAIYRDWTVQEAPLIFVFGRDTEPFIVFRRPYLPPPAPADLGITDIYPSGSLLDEKMDVLIAQLRERGFSGGRIGIEMNLVPILAYERLRSAFPAAEFVDASAFSRTLIGSKTPDQIQCISHALRATEAGFLAMLRECKDRLATEDVVPRTDILRIYRQILLDHGTQPYDEEEFSRAGGDCRRGDVMLFDMFTRYQGLLSDFAASIYLGDTVPDESVATTERARKVIDVVAATITPGMTGNEAEAAADAALKTAFGGRYETDKIEDWWMIHGLGMGVHEEPILGADVGGGRGPLAPRRAQREAAIFCPGLVFNIELLGFGEEVFTVEPDGIRGLGNLRTGVYGFQDID